MILVLLLFPWSGISQHTQDKIFKLEELDVRAKELRQTLEIIYN